MPTPPELIAFGSLYIELQKWIKQTPDAILIDAITALRDVRAKHSASSSAELMAISTMISDWETELDKRSGNRKR